MTPFLAITVVAVYSFCAAGIRYFALSDKRTACYWMALGFASVGVLAVLS